MSTRSQTLFQAALLVLLFTMQGLCHAHQVDHFMAGDSAPCSVCSASGQLEYAAIHTTPALPVEAPVFAKSAFHETLPPSAAPSFRHARAPPLSFS